MTITLIDRTPLQAATDALNARCAANGGCDQDGPPVHRYGADLPSCSRCGVPTVPYWIQATLKAQYRKWEGGR